MKNFNFIKDEEEAKDLIDKSFCKNASIIFYFLQDNETFESHGLRFKYYGKAIYNQDFTLTNDFEIINAENGHLNAYLTKIFRATMALVKGEEKYLADLEKFLNSKVCLQIKKVKDLIKLRKEGEAE